MYHPKVDSYIAAQPAPQREICQALRELFLSAFPLMTEEYKWNYPAYYYQGKRICLASGFKQHVTLELFYGAQLQDTKGKIMGAGKKTRHIKLFRLEDVDAAYLVDLLGQSIALMQASN